MVALSFDEITSLRLSLQPERLKKSTSHSSELPEWQRVSFQQTLQPVEGVVYQRCGGGRRVIKKRIGG